MKITRPNDTTKITEFNSIQEAVDYIKNTPATQSFANRYGGLESISQKECRWYGTSSFDEALDLLRNGWTEKAKELEGKLSQKLNKETTTVTRQKSVYDVVGGNCSVPRYLQGVPTNMVRQVRKPVKEKVVTINYNIGYTCDFTASKIIDNAIECISQVKALEDSGTRVNLNVVRVISGFGTNKKHGWIIPIKKSNERVSLAKMAFAVCHSSMLRRIMFAIEERDEDVEIRYFDYGCSIRDTKVLKKLLPDTEIFETKF